MLRVGKNAIAVMFNATANQGTNMGIRNISGLVVSALFFNLIFINAMELKENTVKTIALVELASSPNVPVNPGTSTNGKINKIAIYGV